MVQSCMSLAGSLQQHRTVYVVTRDRDLGSSSAYEDIQPDTWNHFGNNIQVLYLSPQNLRYKTIKNVIEEIQPHCIYLNSMFSPWFTITPLVAKITSKHISSKLILAPRGMLHQGAIQFGKLKKRIFFNAFRLSGLQKKIVFHATDVTEVGDIRKIFGNTTKVRLIKNFPSFQQQPLQYTSKEPGRLRCIFVSRISPKKNLLYALELLRQIHDIDIELTIVGPVEAQAYWERCQQIIEQLPANITVQYKGAIPAGQLPAIYAAHHLFILPTHGENFGHVIFESMMCGRPVLISNQTPWRQLAGKRAGFDIELSDEIQYINAIREAAAWNQEQFEGFCRSTWQFANEYITGSDLKKEYLELFS
ncbi:MAG: glycosyltransferase family 4 protein [Chitinophagaceae bacterium]